MDHQPAQHLHTLLSALDPSVAAPALRPLERLTARPGSSDELIVALVGASGVGKSEIVNALAGERVVTAGPLRPTTTEIAVWGTVDTSYLPGARISDAEPLNGLVLVDTPAAEHYPDAVSEVLDLVDATIFVTSSERYADATTETLLSTVNDRGIPTLVVLSIDSPTLPGLDALVADAELKLGVAVDGVVSDNADPLRLLLENMEHNRDDLIRQRDRAAAARCAALANEVAGVLNEYVVGSRITVRQADDAFSRARVDRRQLAATADEPWDVAAPAIAAMAAEATDRAINEVATDVAEDAVVSRTVADAAESLPPIDQGAIDEWHRTTTEVSLSSIERRWLHPLRSRAVRDEMWKLSIDFERTPSKRVRKALRGQLPELRYARGEALTAALGDAGSERIAAFKGGLDPSIRVSPSDLRTAAEALAATVSLPGEEAGDVA